MKSSIFQASLILPALAVAGAIGFAAPASMAWAQGAHGAKSASSAKASEPATVPGVVVQAPKPNGIPPEKKAALDAKAAKRKAWSKYRTAPAPTAAATTAAPGTTSASTRAGNYPGLHDLASH